MIQVVQRDIIQTLAWEGWSAGMNGYIRDTNSPDPDCTSFGLVCWSANLYEKLNKGGRPIKISNLGFEVDEVGVSVGFDLAELLGLNFVTI